MLASRHALGIDIGDDACRVVGLRPAGGGYELTFVACLPWEGENDDAALAELLRGAGLGRGTVVSGLPASGCAFKTASLPPGKPAELAQVVRFEAENQFPLPIHELEWGYRLTPEPTGRVHAVIAGARKALVEERLAQLRAGGGSAAALLPVPLAAARAVSRPQEMHIVVLAGADWTDLCLFDDDRLLGCRSVMAGSPDAEGWSDRIAREVRPWLAGHDDIRQIVLLGLVDDEAATALAQSSGLDVPLGNPWQGIRDAGGYLRTLDQPHAAYAAAIGLAQSALDGITTLNLLPRPLLATRRAERKLAWTAVALALALAALIPPTLSGIGRLQHRQASLAEARAALAEATHARVAPLAPGVAQAVQVLQTLRLPESQPLEILSLVSTHLPDGVILTDLAYSRNKAVVLKGRAPSNEVLAQAMSVITRMPVFDSATLDYAVLARDETHPGYDFQITCALLAGSDPTLAAGKLTGRRRMVIR